MKLFGRSAHIQSLVAVALFGSFLGMVPKARSAEHQELTRKETKKLIASTQSREDHLRLAAFYKAKSDKLDAQGAAYEEAATVYRHGPVVKNLMAPNTAARYDAFANRLRQEAQSNRAQAKVHEQMAKSTAGL